MNQPLTPSPTPSGRDELMGVLLLAAMAGAVGVTAYVAGKKAGERKRPIQQHVGIPQHAMLVPHQLKDLAAKADIQPPTALAHLRKLEAEGKVLRIERPEGPRYAILPSLACEWIDPDHGMHDSWQSTGPVDWRFPLVTRVRDARAREFLVEWLDRAQARNLLPPFRSRFEPAKDTPLLQVIVYGSCARGDAGPNSDLDLLIAGDFGKKEAMALVDLAHEVALKGGARNPDVRVMDSKSWASATAALRANVHRDGKTIFTNDPDAHFIESLLQAKNA